MLYDCGLRVYRILLARYSGPWLKANFGIRRVFLTRFNRSLKNVRPPPPPRVRLYSCDIVTFKRELSTTVSFLPIEFGRQRSVNDKRPYGVFIESKNTTTDRETRKIISAVRRWIGCCRTRARRAYKRDSRIDIRACYSLKGLNLKSITTDWFVAMTTIRERIYAHEYKIIRLRIRRTKRIRDVKTLINY